MDEKKKSMFNTVVVTLVAVIFIGVASLLLFVPQIEIKDLCYFCCGAIVVLGIYMIVRYFMTEGYKRLNEYGFSQGVLFVLLGLCGLVSTHVMAASFLTVLGLALLFSGVIKLQYALDLKCMEDKAWAVFFGVTILMLGCGVSVVLKPFQDKVFYQNYTCIILLADGIATLVNILYLRFRTNFYQKKVEEAGIRETEEDDSHTIFSDMEGK